MQELSELLAAHGIPAILKYSHTLIAVIEVNGRIIECNSAWDAIKNANPLVEAVPAFLMQNSRLVFDRLVGLAIEKNIPTHGTLLFLANDPNSEGTEYDCTFVPVPGSRLLFLAEQVSLDPDLAERYLHMSRLAAQLKLDYEHSKQALLTKQKEIDLVVTQAHEVANTDALTFLPNRRQVIGDLQRNVLYSNRYHTPFSISMLDIDHFKRINDTYGHAIGDLVLRQVARYLRDNVRDPDMIGRYGGEEFLVLLPNTSLEAATEQAERLCASIRATDIPITSQAIHVTISAGVAQYHIGEEDWQKLLGRADSALYDAKAQGRDRWASAK
jgi:diguanylate cyclase (GGDEF)-like protein